VGLLAVLVAGAASKAGAVDNVKLIDQARALAGGVTPGDAPGFPVTISQPGSYQLSSNLTVPPDTDGIFITANNVTLNLNGFSIIGSGGLQGSGVGATDGPVVVHNGAVRNMPAYGLDLSAALAARVDKVTAQANGFTGILVGIAGIVTDSSAVANGLTGISGFTSSVIRGNTASNNGTIGISGENSTITDNSSGFNGLHGIRAHGASTVNGNTARNNGGNGLNFFGSISGYMHNVLLLNSGGDVSGGVSLGQNLCSGVVC
jgi:hypothetical protein